MSRTEEERASGAPSNSELYRLLVFQNKQFDEFKKQYKEDMDGVKDILAEARGGWKVFILIGSATTMILAALAWLAKELHILAR